MEKILNLTAGYVLVSIVGEQTERFLNLCKGRNIHVRKIIRQEDGSLLAVFSVKDFFKLRPIRSKTKVHIRILKKYGLPFFFLRSKKRMAFFLGILACICLMLLLSGRIWNIHIEGNEANSTPEILNFLAREGIVHGIAKNKVDCSQIAAMVRKNYPEITWVSARMEGTRLILTIQEGTRPQEVMDEEESPCNITADIEGTIVKMITRKGTPLKKPGDVCQKGDILVLGRLDYRNDSQEVYRYEYVHADADIYVQHEISYYHELPLVYEEQVYTGKEKKGFFLKIGNWQFQFAGRAKEGWNRLVTEKVLRITENFVLPVSFGNITSKEYRLQEKTYSEEKAKSRAIEILHLYEEKLIEKGVQISANNVKIEIDHTTCISRGTFQVIEKIGEETPVKIQEEPQNDLLGTDGQ